MIYTHDEIHELVAYEPGKPIYPSMKIDKDKAKLEQSLFEAADLATQLRLVREESMAIGAERVAIPALLRGKPCEAQKAYSVGLCMTLTTLSKGWFRTFGLDLLESVDSQSISPRSAV